MEEEGDLVRYTDPYVTHDSDEAGMIYCLSPVRSSAEYGYKKLVWNKNEI